MSSLSLPTMHFLMFLLILLLSGHHCPFIGDFGEESFPLNWKGRETGSEKPGVKSQFSYVQTVTLSKFFKLCYQQFPHL